MKKSYRYTLMLLSAGVFGLSSCTRDSVDMATIEDPEIGSAIALSIGEASIDLQYPEEIEALTADSEDELPSSAEEARAIRLTAPSGNGVYPRLSFDVGTEVVDGKTVKQEPFYVFLALRNSNGSKAYYSKQPVRWSLAEVDDNGTTRYRIKSKTSGDVQFASLNGGADLSNADLDEAESWYLDAIYVPNLKAQTGNGYSFGIWNASSKRLNVNGVMPTRFVSAGQSLTIGSDISFPFILKTVEGGNKKTGIVVKRTKETKDNQTRYMLEFPELKNSNIRFEPAGTLYALRFRNGIAGSNGAISGEYYTTLNGRLQASHNYLIKGVSVGSTLATTSGYYNLANLGNPANNGTFSWNTDQKTCYNSGARFASSDWANFSAGTTTGWYYVWMNAVPNASAGARTSFYLDLHNSSLDTDMQSFHAYSTSRAQDGSQYADGKRYYKTVGMQAELRPLPLMLMGYNYISFGKEEAMWGRNNADNSNTRYPTDNSNLDPLAASVYRYGELGRFISLSGGNDPRFTVATYQGQGRPSLRTDLKWMMPDLLTVYSVFPRKMVDINESNNGQIYNIPTWSSQTENVRIEGRPMDNVRSVYYRKDRDVVTPGNWSGENNSVNIYYGVRYIGTPYASAYRYIQTGAVRRPGGQDATRLIIQAKRISQRVGMVRNGNNWVYNEQAVRSYMASEVATGEFWSPTGNEAEYNVLHPNVASRSLQWLGQPTGQRPSEIGKRTSFWIYNPQGLTTGIRYFSITGTGLSAQQNYELVNLNPATRQVRVPILPFLAPSQD